MLGALRHGSHSFTCNSTHPCAYLVNFHQMALPLTCDAIYLIVAYYSSINPERMKGWVALDRWPIAEGRAQSTERSPIKGQCSTTTLRYATGHIRLYYHRGHPQKILTLSGERISIHENWVLDADHVIYEINLNKDTVNCLQDVISGILLELSLATTDWHTDIQRWFSSVLFLAMTYAWGRFCHKYDVQTASDS